MRFALAALALAVPTAAAAQEPSLELGSPWEENVEVPEPPSGAPQITGVDPELLELGRARRAAEPVEEPAGQRRYISYARSFGNAFGGFGIGAAAGWLIGGLVGGGLCANASDWCFFTMMYAGGFAAVIGAPLGAFLGTWGFGDLHGGTGDGWATLGMGVLGAGVGIGVTFALIFVDAMVGVIAGPILAAMTTIMGSALGYHISQRGDVAIRPTVSRPEYGDGLVLGAAGAF